MIEFKTFQLDVKEMTDEGLIKGYASTFGNVDQGGDVVDNGAFKASIKMSGGKIPILADHDPTKQIGWNMTAVEDSKGLLVEGKLNLNVNLAKERYALAKDAMAIGAPMGLSIGYQTIKAVPDEKNPMVRRLKEVKLWEYSLVTFPMNQDAMITAAKSWEKTFSIEDLINKGRELGYTPSQLCEAIKRYADPCEIAQSLDELHRSLKKLTK